MNIVFNTRYIDSPAALFYKSALSRLECVSLFEYENYHDKDIALFMTYPRDLEDLKEAKIKNPNLITAIIDPRGSKIEPYAAYTDFFILDSIEMKDFFAKYNKPMFTYYEYPDIPLIKKNHTNKEKIIIGYHGNKVHLTAMYPEITSALELLGEKYNIELWALYNIAELGMWDIGVPTNISVRHIQWSMEAYEEYLSNVDIGLVPACMPIAANANKKSRISRFFLDSADDYIVKFKMPSNPGRLIVFAKLGIPVVADFLPSNIQFIHDGENGFLAKSTGGWYRAIEQLIISDELRQNMSNNMLDTYHKYFDYDLQNKKFMVFLENMLSKNDGSKVTTKKLKPHRRLVDDLKFNNAFLYEILKRLKGKLA